MKLDYTIERTQHEDGSVDVTLIGTHVDGREFKEPLHVKMIAEADLLEAAKDKEELLQKQETILIAAAKHVIQESDETIYR